MSPTDPETIAAYVNQAAALQGLVLSPERLAEVTTVFTTLAGMAATFQTPELTAAMQQATLEPAEAYRP